MGRATSASGHVVRRDNIPVQDIAMASRPVQIAEARRRLSALVERVARGGGPVVIGRYGHERAVLMGMDEYAHLTRMRRRRRDLARSLEGSLELLCTPCGARGRLAGGS